MPGFFLLTPNNSINWPRPPTRNKNKRESQASSEPYRVTRPRRRQPARLCRPLQLTWSSSNPCFLSRCCNTEQTVAFPVDKTMARIRVATAPGIPLCHPPESRMRSRVTEGHVPTWLRILSPGPTRNTTETKELRPSEMVFRIERLELCLWSFFSLTHVYWLEKSIMINKPVASRCNCLGRGY